MPAEFDALTGWLASYQPGQLLTSGGRPRPHLLPALPLPRHEPDGLPAPRGCLAASAQVAGRAAGRPFEQVVPEVLRARAEQGPFRVFSPDELASNRLDLTDERGSDRTISVACSSVPVSPLPCAVPRKSPV
ncbi:hypothetical protein ACWEF9_14310 [Streptomyces sp. NPDC004980]